jgi:hypothetical protein
VYRRIAQEQRRCLGFALIRTQPSDTHNHNQVTACTPGRHNYSHKHRITGRNLLWFKGQFALSSVQTGFRRTPSLLWCQPPLHRPFESLSANIATVSGRKGVVIAEELIHHSDRGVQYASIDYTRLLEGNEIQISMSRRGNPYDNARAERFMRTLKQEEVYGADYRDLEDARSRIGEFLEQVYNRRRLHSALRYLTPEEFEQAS